MHVLRFRHRWRWLVLSLILFGIAGWLLQPHLPPLLPRTLAVAQLPGASGTLAYKRYSEVNLVITELQQDGLHTSISTGGSPTWAPDGQQLAFIGRVPDPRGQQQTGLFTVALAEMQPRFRSSRGGSEPSWSPDGQTIALANRREDVVLLLDVATDQVAAVALPQVADLANLAWSPDSQYLALQTLPRQEGWWQLTLIERATGAVRYLTSGTHPSWAPDSTTLVYADNDADLYTLSITSGDRTRLTNTPESEWQPYWSPTGDAIAFLGQDNQPWYGEPAWEDIPTGIYRLDLTTRAITPLTGVDANVSSLHGWSPDGTLLAAVGRFAPADASGLAILAADGSGVQLVDPDGADPAWRP